MTPWVTQVGMVLQHIVVFGLFLRQKHFLKICQIVASPYFTSTYEDDFFSF